jgi:hypothetical protein
MSDPIQDRSEYALLKVKVEPAVGAAVAPPSLLKVPTERVAVLVCHGMGQQVPFETLDAIAREVRACSHQCGTATAQEVSVSLHPDEGRFVARAELTLKKPDASMVDVHFYEAYWAPLTEGRVTLRETLSFFLEAGLRGLQFAYREGVFDRWMFNGRQEFEIPIRRVLQFGLALWMLLLVTVAFASTALLPLIKLADILRTRHLDPQLAAVGAFAFSIGLFLVMFGAAAVIIARTLGLGTDAQRPKAVIDAPIGILAPRKWRRNAMLVLLMVIIFALGSLTVVAGFPMYARWLLPAVTAPSAHPFALSVAIISFALEVVLVFVMKEFMIEYAGDVAAYVSPYKVSKFEEIRRAIQDRGKNVARFIYSARTPGSNEPLYNAVFVVGHSLGSVLAYDTLNDAINRDVHEGGWGDGSPSDAYHVIERTKLLLTFGSPLDKTAFIFRTQKTNAEIDVREALAAATQPLILDYTNRHGRWINIWSRSDWISGSLGYYDAPQPEAEQHAVCNIENVGSPFPWKAHTDYWTGQTLRGVLHTALTSICPADVPEPQRSQIISAFA